LCFCDALRIGCKTIGYQAQFHELDDIKANLASYEANQTCYRIDWQESVTADFSFSQLLRDIEVRARALFCFRSSGQATRLTEVPRE